MKQKRLKTALCLALIVPLAFGCVQQTPPSSAPAPLKPSPVSPSVPSQPLKPLGSVELSFNGITDFVSATLEGQNRVTPQALGEASGLTYQSLSQSTFVKGGVRYLSATFKITPNASLTNLTFVAEVKAGTTINDTAVSRLKRFDGTDADAALALNIKPTHGLTLIGADQNTVGVSSGLADFQAFAESDLSGYTPSDGGYLLPYGFVAKTATGTRTLTSANPGYVTFAFQMPSTGDSDPYSFSVFLQAATDPTTRVTESLAEVASSNVLARANAVQATQINVLPSTEQFTTTTPDPRLRLLCTTRTAGTQAAPQQQLSNVFPLAPGAALSPAPNALSVALTNPGVSANVLPCSPSVLGVPMMRSGFQGYADAQVSQNSTSVSLRPARPYLPGEELEVSLPPSASYPNLSGYVYRFRTSSLTSAWVADAVSTTLSAFQTGVALGDLNGDGKLEVVTSSSDIALGDLDNNGKLDKVETFNTAAVSISFQQNDGTFTTTTRFATSLTESTIRRSALSDINGDGFTDIVTVNRSSFTGSYSVFLNKGNRTFSDATEIQYPSDFYPSSVTIGDLNNDGRPDIVGGIVSGNIFVQLQNPSGSFSVPVQYTVSPGIDMEQVVLGDLNADAKLDAVITTNFEGAVAVLTGDGKGGFSPALKVPAGTKIRGVALGDLNGDGKLDITAADNDGKSVAVLFNESNTAGSTPTFSSARKLPFNQFQVRVALGDLNGDGRLDIITTGGSANPPQRFTILSVSQGASLSPSALALDWNSSRALSFNAPSGQNVRSLVPPTWTSSDDGTVGVTDGTVQTYTNTGSADVKPYPDSSLVSRVVTTNNPLLGALDLTDASDYVTVRDDSSLELEGNFTLEMWVRVPDLSALPSGDVVLLEKRSRSGGPFPYSLTLDSSRKVRFDLRTTSSTTQTVSTLNATNQTPLSDGNWHHIAVTSTLSGIGSITRSLQLFVDGAQVDSDFQSNAVTTTSNTASLSLGAAQDGTLKAPVQIDEVRLWKVTRSAQDIAGLLGTPFSAPYPPDLVAYFKMDEIGNSGTTRAPIRTLVNEINSGLTGRLSSTMTGLELIPR